MCTEGKLSIYKTSFKVDGLFNPFALVQIRQLASEPLRTLSWSYDSKLIVCGGDDKRLWIVDPVKKYANLTAYGVSGHRGKIVGCFFMNENSFDICSIDERGVGIIWDCNLTPSDLVVRTGDEETDNIVKKIDYSLQKT